ARPGKQDPRQETSGAPAAARIAGGAKSFSVARAIKSRKNALRRVMGAFTAALAQKSFSKCESPPWVGVVRWANGLQGKTPARPSTTVQFTMLGASAHGRLKPLI